MTADVFVQIPMHQLALGNKNSVVHASLVSLESVFYKPSVWKYKTSLAQRNQEYLEQDVLR